MLTFGLLEKNKQLNVLNKKYNMLCYLAPKDY